MAPWRSARSHRPSVCLPRPVNVRSSNTGAKTGADSTKLPKRRTPRDGALVMRVVKATPFFLIALLVSSQALATDSSVQPLTRADCNTAGMHWDDSANVCGSAQSGPNQAGALVDTTPAATPPPSGASSKSGLKQSKKKTATKRHGYRRTSHHTTPVPSKTSEHHPFRLFPHFKKTGRANQ